MRKRKELINNPGLDYKEKLIEYSSKIIMEDMLHEPSEFIERNNCNAM